jgi:hypothetical protein
MMFASEFKPGLFFGSRVIAQPRQYPNDECEESENAGKYEYGGHGVGPLWVGRSVSGGNGLQDLAGLGGIRAGDGENRGAMPRRQRCGEDKQMLTGP